MRLGRFDKHPGELENYSIDYTDDLAASDGLISAQIEIDQPGLVLSGHDIEGNLVRIWLSGGNVGTSYLVTATVVTASGRRLQDAFVLRIKEI